ncbi:MAG TPA: OmpA family protein [Chitinophagaceae bacterium]|nr:OmpA family protein [Chitinophagaceae bacterium]
MKKILAALLALFLIGPAGFSQDDEIRPAAIGVSFILNDYTTAQRIRSSSLSSVINNGEWADVKDMAPGLALSYFKGLRKHIDFAGNLAGSFARYTIPNHAPSSTDKFLLEADASLNFKMVSEKYWVQPYLLAGLGAQMYGGSYFGAFIPTGVGMKLNLFDDAHIFVTAQYRIPVTKESVEYHFFNQFGIAGRIGKKKEPALKVIPPLPVDTDNDGIIDSLDKCPTVPGLTKYEGCPVPDTDKDGINDEEDKCPTAAGVARYQGCPVPDTDKDGINDEEDKCPTEVGPANNQGCPFKDTDGDGVIDEQDKCPTVAGTRENDGCPAIPEFDAKNVQFVFGKATLSKPAAAELDDMAAYLLKYPELKLEIHGHTDNVGKASVNQRLSERRAAAAKNYLVKKGVSADRITSAGFGMTQPLVDNKTAANRALNRRIEFRISQ